MSVSRPLLLTADIFNAWQRMLGMQQVTYLNFKYAYTHIFRHSSNSGQNISSCPCRGSQKPCSRTAIPESSLQGRKKIIKSNVTSEKRANIWEIKPKWISLAYFQQNKTAHFTSPPLSLLSSDCWVQALKAHTHSSTENRYHMHHG